MSGPASLGDFAAMLASGETTLQAALDATFARIDEFDSTLRCYREVDRETAQQDVQHALALQKQQTASAARLFGAMVAVKDNIVTDTGITTAGSKMLADYRSPFSATVIDRLRAAGAVILGKTNCDEFGMGSSTEHCAFGCTRNPWDLTRVPGGSSGGSAAAVAAGLCTAALGSDTGGSIRQPASFCGVVGLKPSYGRVSRYGLIAYGSSLEQIGPITRNVTDAAIFMQVLAGPDPLDSTSADRGVPDYTANLDEPIRNLRIGVPQQYLSDENDPAVNQRIHEAIDIYRSLGATVVELDLTLTDKAIPAYYVIAMAEASSNLARYDGVRYGRRASLKPDEGLLELYIRSRTEGFGPEVIRRIMLGTYVLSAGYYDAYYHRAMQVRRLIRQQLDDAFTRCDVLLGPTSPIPPFEFGEIADPVSMYLADVYTIAANLAGLCAISIPCGSTTRSNATLPIGMQLQAKPFDEPMLLRAARMFEDATDHHTHTPPLGSPVNAR